MTTGNRNPLFLPEDEQYHSFLNTQISGKLVKTDNDKFIFPPLTHQTILPSLIMMPISTQRLIMPLIMYLRQCQ